MFCGAEGIRTLILFLAKEALSQLSYNPKCFPPEIRTPIQWLKTTCPAIRREENIVAISRLELLTGSYPIWLMRPALHLHCNIVAGVGIEPT